MEDGTIDRLVSLPSLTAMAIAEAMARTLRLHIKQGIQQVRQHGILSGLRERSMKFKVERLALSICLWQRFSRIKDIAHPLEIKLGAAKYGKTNDLSFEKSTRFPQ